jgi:hypothetical protein
MTFDIVCMNWFKKGVKPAWTFKARQISNGLRVWRLLPSTDEILVVELRDVETKSVRFIAVNLITGTVLWSSDLSDAGVGNARWWITLNKIYGGVVYLQHFSRPDMPTSNGIFALDLFTGELLWQDRETLLISVFGDTLYGLRRANDLDSGILVELDRKTGKEIGNYRYERLNQGNNVLSKVAEANEEESRVPWISPERVEEVNGLSEVKKWIPDFAVNPMAIRLSRSSEESNGTIDKDVVGYYVGAGKDEKGIPVFDARLLIIESDEKVFEDVVDREVYSVLQDIFFVVKGKLIYVKHSVDIVALQL